MSEDEPTRPGQSADELHTGFGWFAYSPPDDSLSAPPPDDSDRMAPPDGTVIRVMWDYGVDVPLWDPDGLLPEDRLWLRYQLGLGDLLIADLRRWCDDMERFDFLGQGMSTSAQRNDGTRVLNARGKALSDRVRAELAGRYVVEYQPW